MHVRASRIETMLRQYDKVPDSFRDRLTVAKLRTRIVRIVVVGWLWRAIGEIEMLVDIARWTAIHNFRQP